MSDEKPVEQWEVDFPENGLTPEQREVVEYAVKWMEERLIGIVSGHK